MVGLNDYRDEVNEFLRQVTDEPEPLSQIVNMLDQEMALLKASFDNRERLSHQLYDVLFLLFEVAAVHNLNLDSEWTEGRERKRTKYLNEPA